MTPVFVSYFTWPYKNDYLDKVAAREEAPKGGHKQIVVWRHILSQRPSFFGCWVSKLGTNSLCPFRFTKFFFWVNTVRRYQDFLAITEAYSVPAWYAVYYQSSMKG